MKGCLSCVRIAAIARKEVAHILRDRFTLAMALIMPVILVTIFGLAIDLDLRGIRLTVFDSDQTQTSRIVSQAFTNSGYFVIAERPLQSNPEEVLSEGRARAALIIPKGFEQDLENGRSGIAQVLVDGTDNSTVGVISGYIQGIQTSLIRRLAERAAPTTIELKPRYLFNPELKSSWFIVPGLSVVILSILSILLTSLTVAREWELGSMELLLGTPLHPVEIVIGKILPYLGLGLIGAAFVYLSARLGFGVPFTGSHLVYLAGTLLFLCTYLAQGVLISVIAKSQAVAMQMGILSGFLPSLLLSGFIFSIENMSPFWQYFTMILPARWYMVIVRASYLKGATFADLAVPFAALAILCALLIFVAVKRFRGDLES